MLFFFIQHSRQASILLTNKRGKGNGSISAENCDKQQELLIEEQKDEEDNAPIASNRKIFTDKGDPEVDSLYQKWKKGKLVLQPEFQRHFV